MNNEKKSFGSMLKGLVVGMTIGAVTTIFVTNNKISKKVKNASENTIDNVTSMFKMN